MEMPAKQFKVMVIRKFTKLKRSMDLHRQNFNKEMGVKKNQSEIKNKILK